MKFCVLKNNNSEFLGVEAVEGHKYSTLTQDPAGLEPIFLPLYDFLNSNSFYRLTIFENEEAARKFADSNIKLEVKTVNLIDLED